MRIKARYIGASRTIDGDLSLSFAVDDEVKAELEQIADKDLVLEVSQYKKKRSLNANSYFWKLCDLIAQKLRSDKDTIYLLMLKEAGVFEIHDVIAEGVPLLEPLFRYIEVDYEYKAICPDSEGNERQVTIQSLKCYHGSHEYDTAQMSRLIDMTVQEAKDLGIETMTPDEIEHLKATWRAK